MCSLKVIPVAIGSDANSNELEKVTTNRKNLVTSPKDEDPKSLGRKIMSVVIKGDVLSVFFTDYQAYLVRLVPRIWQYIKTISPVAVGFFFSILINCVLGTGLIFIKRKYLSITISDERRRYATKANSQMSDNKTERLSFGSYSLLLTKYSPVFFSVRLTHTVATNSY